MKSKVVYQTPYVRLFLLLDNLVVYFSHSTTSTTAAFELLHLDIWGPYHIKTPTGCNQFLTIVDDYSKFTWIHLLKHKSDVAQVLQSFVAYVSTKFSGTK